MQAIFKMEYHDFEQIVSQARMKRYLDVCSKDVGNATNNEMEKAIKLYRLNINLSQEIFTFIGCFEIALRNATDFQYRDVWNAKESDTKKKWGDEWLINAEKKIFHNIHNNINHKHFKSIQETIRQIDAGLAELKKRKSDCAHDKLIAELTFGFWCYLFAEGQFKSSELNIGEIFPMNKIPINKNLKNPKTIKEEERRYVFGKLKFIHKLRNRIAHHEPLCFLRDKNTSVTTINTEITEQNYALILKLFKWLDIDAHQYCYGLEYDGATDPVMTVINEINNLKATQL